MLAPKFENQSSRMRLGVHPIKAAGCSRVSGPQGLVNTDCCQIISCPCLSTVPPRKKNQKQYVLIQHLIAAVSANQNPERAKKGERLTLFLLTHPPFSLSFCVYLGLWTQILCFNMFEYVMQHELNIIVKTQSPRA